MVLEFGWPQLYRAAPGWTIELLSLCPFCVQYPGICVYRDREAYESDQ